MYIYIHARPLCEWVFLEFAFCSALQCMMFYYIMGLFESTYLRGDVK